MIHVNMFILNIQSGRKSQKNNAISVVLLFNRNYMYMLNFHLHDPCALNCTDKHCSLMFNVKIVYDLCFLLTFVLHCTSQLSLFIIENEKCWSFCYLDSVLAPCFCFFPIQKIYIYLIYNTTRLGVISLVTDNFGWTQKMDYKRCMVIQHD